MSMDKKDKVIKALEFCTSHKVVDTCYGECPYAVADDDYRCRDMKLDALAMLKEQEETICAYAELLIKYGYEFTEGR